VSAVGDARKRQAEADREPDLLAALGALADEWEAEAGEDQAWLNGPHVAVSEAHELPALIRQALAHVAELRQAIAAHQPAEPDDGEARREAALLRARRESHERAERELDAHQSERIDTPVIERVDRYTITINGHRITATERQEHRIRQMTPEQVANFLRVTGAAQPSEPERGER
jgi:hypothetical protein